MSEILEQVEVAVEGIIDQNSDKLVGAILNRSKN